MASSQPISAPVAAIVGYGVGGVALLALAAPAPRLATTIVVILLVSVLLVRSDSIAAILTAGTDALDTLTNHSQPSK